MSRADILAPKEERPNYLFALATAKLVCETGENLDLELFCSAMTNPPVSEGTARKTHRVEIFSDAVLAIAITLPIVDLHGPAVERGGDLAAGYIKLNSEYQAYILSFIVIGLYWAYWVHRGVGPDGRSP